MGTKGMLRGGGGIIRICGGLASLVFNIQQGERLSELTERQDATFRQADLTWK